MVDIFFENYGCESSSSSLCKSRFSSEPNILLIRGVAGFKTTGASCATLFEELLSLDALVASLLVSLSEPSSMGAGCEALPEELLSPDGLLVMFAFIFDLLFAVVPSNEEGGATLAGTNILAMSRS